MLGGHLIRELLRENSEVAAIKRKSSETQSLKSIFGFYGDDVEDLYNRITWIEADVEDYYALCKAFEGIKYVYHCAARVNLGKNDNKMFEVNVGGTKNVVDAALINKVRKLCFVSSIAALSDGNGQNEIDEETPAVHNNTNTIYGESKRLAELEIKKGIDKGLDSVIVKLVSDFLQILFLQGLCIFHKQSYFCYRLSDNTVHSHPSHIPEEIL